MSMKEELEAVEGRIFAEPFEVKEAKDQDELELREQDEPLREGELLPGEAPYECERHGRRFGAMLIEGDDGKLEVWCSTCLGEAMKKLGLVPMKRSTVP